MATITAAISDLAAVGPILEVHFAVPPQLEDILKADGKPVPPPIAGSMMVDTGASNTVIETGLAAKLGLQPVGAIQINTPNATSVCMTYAVRLLLPKGVVAAVVATEAPMMGQSINGLIGRDLLQHGVLIYLGTENQFTLTF